MVRSAKIQTNAESSIKVVVERVLTLGAMSRQEHLQLTSVILANHKISEEERRQINRVFDYVQTGRLRLVD